MRTGVADWDGATQGKHNSGKICPASGNSVIVDMQSGQFEVIDIIERDTVKMWIKGLYFYQNIIIIMNDIKDLKYSKRIVMQGHGRINKRTVG